MRFLRLLLIYCAVTSASAATFTWSGAAGDRQLYNPGNWVGGVVPPNDGSATVVFTDTGAGAITVPFSVQVSEIQFQNTPGKSYSFNTPVFAIIGVKNGLTSAGGGLTQVGGNVWLDLKAPQTVDVSNGGTLAIDGLVAGHHGLTKVGNGTLRFNGLTLYTGGTRVTEGSVVFGNSLSVPLVGQIESSARGYVGATFSDNLQASLIDRIDPSAFFGTIGLDADPGQAVGTFTGQIDVSELGSFAGLGSQTAARVTGEIKAAQGGDYLFGNGGGTLYVESNLTARSNNVLVRSARGIPLTLVLRGTNTFKGALNVLNSVVVLDSDRAISSNTQLNLEGAGYIGYTERWLGTPDSFLSRLGTIGSPNAIAGIDSVDVAQPRTVTQAIDLSVGGTRSDPYYLGTSTRVTVTGAITPTVGDSLYLTAVKGGHLNVASNLGSNIPAVVVGQTDSFDPRGGTVELSGNNSYSGGTQVRGGTLQISNSNAAGSGAVLVADRATLNIGASVLFSNPLSLTSGARLSGTGGLSTPGGVLITPRSILSPGGTGSVGTLTFNTGLTFLGGSAIDFDIHSLSGGPGAGWDFINVAGGALNFSVLGAPSSTITININTLLSANMPGDLNGFDASQSYSWNFASAGQMSGFSAVTFNVNTSGFANALNGGNFFVTQTAGNLAVNFAPVPEPSTYALMAIGLAGIGLVEWRRRRRS